MFWRTSYKVVPIVFLKPEKIIQEKDCPICLNPLNTSVYLPCGHSFHDDCILDWIEKKKTCPTCRMHLQWSLIKKKKN
tara:strand:+ start:2393 stop:2626 length:234 start_codon:yes stop_codon:yes gene_type:complete